MGYHITMDGQIEVSEHVLDRVHREFTKTDKPTPPPIALRAIEEAIEDQGFYADGWKEGKAGDIVYLFSWDGDKSDREEDILRRFATAGATGNLYCRGEDGDQWRYRLSKNKLHVDAGRVVYD